MYLPQVDSPRWVVFADFDETYLAHDGAPEQRRDRRALEQVLMEEARPRGILFGWVADGPIDTVAATVAAHGLRVVPHFIASARGAELELFSREGGRRPWPEWEARIAASGFSRARVSAALDDLSRQGIALVRREQAGRRIDCHRWVPPRGARPADFAETIRRAAELHGVHAHVLPANELDGGPADGWDVDFVPRGAGKRQVVEFVLERTRVPRSRALGFGDDVGDLEMLLAVEHGYLVDNATDEARRRFSRTAGASHARGILEVIEHRILGAA
jgi:kanosamine-6-phosphate phosphatase